MNTTPVQADSWILSYKPAGEPQAVASFRNYESADAIYRTLHDAVIDGRILVDAGPTLTACGESIDNMMQ